MLTLTLVILIILLTSALSVISEDSYDESASIKKNDGHQSQSGTKLQTHDIIDAETQLEENEFDQSDFLDSSILSAAVSVL